MNKSSFTPFLNLDQQEFEPLFPAIVNKIADNKLKAEEALQGEVEVVADEIEKVAPLPKYSPDWWEERRNATQNNEN